MAVEVSWIVIKSKEGWNGREQGYLERGDVREASQGHTELSTGVRYTGVETAQCSPVTADLGQALLSFPM